MVRQPSLSSQINQTEGSSFNLVKDFVKLLENNSIKYKGYKIYLHNFAKFDSISY